MYAKKKTKTFKPIKSDDEITDGGVTLNDGHSITFSCSYSLAPHSVSQYSSVHGHDSSTARNKTSVGGLGYRLVVDDGFIGNRVNFSVIPVNPGLVHSRIKNCIVSSQNNHFSYVIFGKNNKYCMDSITNFEIINEYESMATQKFSYTGRVPPTLDSKFATTALVNLRLNSLKIRIVLI